MKKYLFVVRSLSFGGAERVVTLLANELVTKGKDVYIAIFFRSDNEYSVDSKVKIKNLSNLNYNEYLSENKILRYIKRLFLLKKYVNYIQPNFIIPFCVDEIVEFAVNSKYYNIIHTIRNNPKIDPVNRYRRLIRDYYIKNSKCTIVQNITQARYFQNKCKGSIEVIPNPIGKEFVTNNARIKYLKNKTKIISVGRLVPQKNFQMLINATYELRKEREDFCVEIYGQKINGFKNIPTELNALIIERELTDFVYLKGRSEQIQTVYKNSDIYVLTSNFEGMPNSLLEAMAMGLACISTNCETGPSDMIIDGINGYLIPMNDVCALKEKLLYLMNNQKIRETVGDNAREFVLKNFSVEMVVNNFIDVCEKIQ